MTGGSDALYPTKTNRSGRIVTAGRSGPCLLSGVGRGEDNLRDQDGNCLPVDALGERRLEVVRPIAGDDLRGTRGTDSARERGVRGSQLRCVAVRQPRLPPERGRGRLLGR